MLDVWESIGYVFIGINHPQRNVLKLLLLYLEAKINSEMNKFI